MQRLFTMFPLGLPAVALLFMRGFMAAILVGHVAHAHAAPVFQLLMIIVALALLLGAATPIAALIAGALDLFALRSMQVDLNLHTSAPLCICVVLAILGPGCYSLDARLFGRRLMRVDAPDSSLDE